MNLDDLVERVKGHKPGSWHRGTGSMPGSMDGHAICESAEIVAHVIPSWTRTSPRRSEANCELIAAAPSLLTLALEQAEEMKRLRAELEQVRGALAKVPVGIGTISYVTSVRSKGGHNSIPEDVQRREKVPAPPSPSKEGR